MAILKPLKSGYVRAKQVGAKGNRQIKIGGNTYNTYVSSFNRREQLRVSKIKSKKRRKKAKKINVKKNIRWQARKKLTNGDVSGAYNMVSAGIKFSKVDTDMFLNIINPLVEQKYVMKFTLTDGTIKYATLKNDNLDDFMEALQNNYFSELNEIEHGSDIIEGIIQRGIKAIKLVKPKPRKKMKGKGSKFFRYLNNTDIDLTRYQIIQNEEQKEILNEHCLIYALSKCGIEKDKLDCIKTSFDPSSHFPKKNLKGVADIIKKKIILSSYRNTRTDINKEKFGKQYDDSIEIATYKDHYFINDITDFSTYSSKHYQEVKDIDNYKNINKYDSKKRYRFKNDCKKCNSLQLINNLFNSGNFEKDNFIITYTAQYQKCNNKDIPLTNIHNEQLEYEYQEKEIKDRVIFFADTEAETTIGSGHKGLMIGVVKYKKNNSIKSTRTFIKNNYVCSRNQNKEDDEYRKHCKCLDNDCRLYVDQFLNYVVNNSEGTKPIVYFHNLKYDYHILLPYIYQAMPAVEKDNQYYSVTICYNKKMIEFRDSYKLAPIALSKFNETFQLSKDLDKKEAIAYEYYKTHNMHKTKISIKLYKTFLQKKQIKIFDEALENNKRLFEVTKKTFNPIEYYRYYLKYDTLVLCEGLRVYQKTINEITKNKLDLFNYLTISSLTNSFMGLKGAFNGLYQVAGNLREFISMAVTGGRVQCLEETKKQVIKRMIADYDGVSLYPSAIYRLCKKYGLPLGECKRIQKYTKKELDRYSYYIVKVDITKINKKQQLPFVSYKDDDGILRYTNTVPEKGLSVVIDKYTLEDWIKFQEIEYTIKDGVYWNSGFNKKMGDVIDVLFTDRLKHKKAGNDAMQQILKLMMNSSYGKTIIKKSMSEKKIIKEKDLDDFLHNYYYLIKKPVERLNSKQYIAVLDGVDNSFNLAHVGVSILSMSKRIMNEVFDIANDNGLPIYYTDTDSMHCNYEDVPIIERKFREKYNRELTGKQLGQFHIDFSLKGACSEIYATKSIFLGKKCYIDCLESKDKDGNKITGYHFRMKGVTVAGLEDKAKKYDGGMFELYESLIDEKIKICLNPKGKFMCKYKNNEIQTWETNKFTRELSF